MKIPTTLKHKPVIVAENYDSIDGRGAYHSDAKGLSLGLAQWNDRGKVDISAKVWRHTGEKTPFWRFVIASVRCVSWPSLTVSLLFISMKCRPRANIFSTGFLHWSRTV